jgi:hypothetical protein
MWTVFWLKSRKEGDHLGELGVNGRVIIKWIIRNGGGRVWTGFM